MGRRYRRASEIGEFVYCQRAWWLHQVQGHAPGHPARLARGEAAHARHARTLYLAAFLQRLALGLVALALLVALFLWWSAG